MGKNVHCVNLASYSSKTVVTLLKFYGILQKGRFWAKKSRRILGTQVSTWFEFRRKSILSWLVDSNYSSISEFSIADYCHFCWTYLYLYQSLVPYQSGSQVQWFRSDFSIQLTKMVLNQSQTILRSKVRLHNFYLPYTHRFELLE